jgi:[protein-PII] uridylyltransferase
VDTLQVETLERTPVTDQQVWQQVEADLQTALRGALHVETILAPRRSSAHDRKLQAFAQPPQVLIENTSSDSHTIIEVQAQDHLGLLYKLTRVLYESGLDVALAKISTEANRAIDVFYVADAAGRKVVDDSARETIRQALLDALR